MTSAQRIALERALMRHPEVRERFTPIWRVKRLGDGELLKLGKAYGITPPEPRPITYPAPRLEPQRATRQVHEGAFKGILCFPIRFTVLGQEVVREVRIDWGYTPEWDHMTRDCQGIVRGAPEEVSMSCQILTERQHGHLRYAKWIASDLLAEGVLPEALVTEVERLIDEDAREQNAERLRGRRL